MKQIAEKDGSVEAAPVDAVEVEAVAEVVAEEVVEAVVEEKPAE